MILYNNKIVTHFLKTTKTSMNTVQVKINLIIL